MARVFHGFMNKNNDSTNRVIEKKLYLFLAYQSALLEESRRCGFQSENSFSRTQTKKVKFQDFKRYCRARGREDVKVIYLKKNNYVVK